MDGVTTVTDRGVPPEPTTAAGRKLLNEFGPENHEVRADILEIERQARTSQPLTLDVERTRRAFRVMMDKGLLTGGFIHDDQWAAVFEMEYERAK